MRDIKVTDVQIKDSFWSAVQNTVIDVMIPYQERVLNDAQEGVEKSHAIENFRIAAGEAQGKFYGMVFQDSDVAKWIEGVAYALAVKPDPKLEARADEIIRIIEKAQHEDGYLNTFFTLEMPGRRWQNLRDCHELYCAGHMMEAAVAYYQTTGKDTLLKVMLRMADHIDSIFGEDKRHGVPGHQEVEIGLFKLYQTTGEEKYKKLARFFIEERGKNPNFFEEETEERGWKLIELPFKVPNTYNQAHATVYEQTEAVGHSVRAVYMYTAMAALAREDKDQRLFEACERLWENMTNRRMYITGGIGSTHEGESFTGDYDLPNDTSYTETCASIGLVFFASQMLKMKHQGKYADVMERALYNGILSGMQMDGTRFLYVNPLEVNPNLSGKIQGHEHVCPSRVGWYACACCPPNVVRMVTSLGKYVWDEDEDTIYANLFVGGRTSLALADVEVENSYPWLGQVTYKLSPKTTDAFTLAIHIPNHVKTFKLLCNGEEASYEMKEGYAYIRRSWKAGDTIELTFDMPVRKVFANSKVSEDASCIALMRGPIVYCLEGADFDGDLNSVRIPYQAKVEAFTCTEGVLKGQTHLKFTGVKICDKDQLYYDELPELEKVELTAIPYFAWGNRSEGQMRVWIPLGFADNV